MSERRAWGFPLPAPGGTAPALDRFKELAPGRRVIPIVRRLLADGETPVGLYRKLAQERPGTFLLESAEHGRAYSRFSFVGVRSSALLTERDGAVAWWGTPPLDVPRAGDPLEALRATVEILRTDRPEGLPPLTGGMVGYLSYDAVRRWDEDILTFRDFGQSCDRFGADGGLAPGDEIRMGGLDWRAIAAPGHDPDSLVLHCPQARLLISADALWDNGFGVIFPELTGASGFAEQGAVLDAIAALDVDVALPGHGPLIADVPGAVARARSRLQAFVSDPRRSPRNAIKVMLKFLLLDRQRMPLALALATLRGSRTIGGAAAQLGLDTDTALRRSAEELLAQGQLILVDGDLLDTDPTTETSR